MVTSWATPERVYELTGVAVQPEQLGQAQGVIDLYAGATMADAAQIKGRDTRLLEQAVAYQAAWLAFQADAFTRTDVTAVNQDGVSATFAGEDALTLGPLARRCLARLSWRKSRSVSIRAAGPRTGSIEAWQSQWLRDEEPVQPWRQGWV